MIQACDEKGIYSPGLYQVLTNILMKRRTRSIRTFKVILSIGGILLFLAVARVFEWSLLLHEDVVLLKSTPTSSDSTMMMMTTRTSKNSTFHDDANGKRSIPKMHSDGGFILFLHVPKTGGTTIRDAMMTKSDLLVEYHFVSGRKLFNQANIKAMKYLTSPSPSNRNESSQQSRRKTFFLEIHGRDSPNLLELMDTIQTYRDMAHQHNIPIFTFSILREPMAFAISYFNFFYVQRGPNPYFRQVEPNESNLVELNLYNPQCQFLSRGEMSLRLPSSSKAIPTEEECLSVYDALIKQMDWVGTTEQLDGTTLPLLRKVLGSLPASTLSFPSRQVSRQTKNESVAPHELSPTAVGTLRDMSRLDQDLYDKIKDYFSLDRWAVDL